MRNDRATIVRDLTRHLISGARGMLKIEIWLQRLLSSCSLPSPSQSGSASEQKSDAGSWSQEKNGRGQVGT